MNWNGRKPGVMERTVLMVEQYNKAGVKIELLGVLEAAYEAFNAHKQNRRVNGNQMRHERLFANVYKNILAREAEWFALFALDCSFVKVTNFIALPTVSNFVKLYLSGCHYCIVTSKDISHCLYADISMCRSIDLSCQAVSHTW